MNEQKLEKCPMRNEENGNCSPLGGFCQPHTELCLAVKRAYEYGLTAGAKEAMRRAPLPDNKALTVECCGTCGHCEPGDGAPYCDNLCSTHYGDFIAETDGCMWYKRRMPEKGE